MLNVFKVNNQDTRRTYWYLDYWLWTYSAYQSNIFVVNFEYWNFSLRVDFCACWVIRYFFSRNHYLQRPDLALLRNQLDRRNWSFRSIVKGAIFFSYRCLLKESVINIDLSVDVSVFEVWAKMCFSVLKESFENEKVKNEYVVIFYFVLPTVPITETW